MIFLLWAEDSSQKHPRQMRLGWLARAASGFRYLLLALRLSPGMACPPCHSRLRELTASGLDLLFLRPVAYFLIKMRKMPDDAHPGVRGFLGR